MSELVLVANAGDGTISTLRLVREPDPALEHLATSDIGPGCGTFAIDADRNLVYAAFKEDSDSGDPPGIATLRLDRESGELTEISRRLVSDSLCYLSLNHDASVLLGASYGGGFAATYPVTNGTLGRVAAHVEFANCHCVVASEHHAYVVSLGDTLVAQYDLAADGHLTPLDPPTVAAPEGSGPRHLILEGDNAYLITEFSGEAIRHSITPTGALVPHERVEIFDAGAGLKHSTFGADPRAGHLIWGADIHRAGRWLICSERTASTLAAVDLLGDGRLGGIVSFAGTETQPRGFTTTADGRFVVAVGERSTDAALSSVGDDGTLTLLGKCQVGRGANWVQVIG